MTISTLVDSNILIDVLGNGPHQASASESLAAEMMRGDVVLSVVVWAELAFSPVSETDLLHAIAWMRLRREDLPFEAGHPAGRAHRLYRERGGQRERTLPDFLIGAHALVAGHRLLTRDAGRYRSYFPTLDIICPETHP